MNRLKTYIDTGNVPCGKRRQIKLAKQKLVDLFTVNLILTCLHVQKQSLHSCCEAAVDTLCVTGLVGFPLTEAGPLNYAARLGWMKIVHMFEDSVNIVPFVADICGARNSKTLISEDSFLDIFATNKFVASDHNSCSDLTELFQLQRPEMMLLNHAELQMVGRCQGVVNKELFLLPICIILGLTVWCCTLFVILL